MTVIYAHFLRYATSKSSSKRSNGNFKRVHTQRYQRRLHVRFECATLQTMRLKRGNAFAIFVRFGQAVDLQFSNWPSQRLF